MLTMRLLATNPYQPLLDKPSLTGYARPLAFQLRRTAFLPVFSTELQSPRQHPREYWGVAAAWRRKGSFQRGRLERRERR